MKPNEISIGKTFEVAGIEFIKFDCDGDRTVAVAKDALLCSVFGNNNNFVESKILERLQNEVLSKIEKEVGAENVFEFSTDLLTLDGSSLYGEVTSKISIPTFDFYRRNVKIFDEYKLDSWWWLATADSTVEHLNDKWCICVSPRGDVDYDCSFNDDIGVRPVLVFESNISVS